MNDFCVFFEYLCFHVFWFLLLTGLHDVADIFCKCCKHMVGWKYERAYEKSQKYKGECSRKFNDYVFTQNEVFLQTYLQLYFIEGRFIIEQAHIVKTSNWIN